MDISELMKPGCPPRTLISYGKMVPTLFPLFLFLSHCGFCNMIFRELKETANLKIQGCTRKSLDILYLSEVIFHKRWLTGKFSHLYCRWHEFCLQNILYWQVISNYNIIMIIFKFLWLQRIILVFKNTSHLIFVLSYDVDIKTPVLQENKGF